MVTIKEYFATVISSESGEQEVVFPETVWEASRKVGGEGEQGVQCFSR